MAAQSIRDVGILTYDRCERLLRGRDFRNIARNTSLTREDGVIYVVYHRTRILAFHKDGAVIADCAGYRTVSTKDRLNALADAGVYQKKFVWYIGRLEFYDGVNVGTPRNEREALEQAVMRGDEAAVRALNDYNQDHP